MNPASDDVVRRWWPLAPLLGLVLFAWCAAAGISSPADLLRPPAYTEDPNKSDILWVYAAMRAATEGDALPFLWKRVGRLNAPAEAVWNDWPSIEEIHGLALFLAARTLGLFGGLNAALLLGHLLAAATFFGVALASGCAARWAFVGGLAYGLAPYLFAQSPHHSGVQWAWHVPLFTLVWRWVSTDPGLEPGSPRFRTATGIGLLTGLLNVYYTNIFCQLTLVGAGIRFLRTRARPALLAAGGVVAAAAVAFAVSNLDTWTYKAVHGPSPGAVVREYKWLEIYGLKIKDLFIPPVTHRSPQLAAFSRGHRQVAPLLDEDGASYQGLVGLAALLWLAATAVDRMARGREREVPLEAWQVLWIVLVFTTGGLNALVGALGFTMFRGGCRASIVILAITLLWAARRLTGIETARGPRRQGAPPLFTWLAAGLCGVILWDQVPAAPSRETIADIGQRVAADREFASRMEAALPPGALVFQLPVVDFPETPVPGVPPYDHFRPYLFSERLRFSFGTVKGREPDRWQQAVQAKLLEGATLDQQSRTIRLNPASARAAVDHLETLGFSAIYVNRRAFADGGRGVEGALLDLGYRKPPIVSAGGDVACVLLQK